jgi:hypothetical protein
MLWIFPCQISDRELLSDIVVVNGLLLEWLEGTPLASVDPHKMEPRKQRENSRTILDIIKSAYAKGVYRMRIDFSDFFLVHTRTPRMYAFSVASSIDEFEPGAAEYLPKLNLERMTRLSDKAGFR